ncbi:MAG: dTDP-4-dehydrorhamnose 3,5-epimerase family protein [Aliarcobacter sp.]|nr:dTDP-4-dehydrorhamnose 3,5-epimerase family protein [Aliarcobacter sp.]MBP7225997.1 dTDP-4-dehydrorhamnose 3,5-epimerase family protein [Aliarcobacter sp.]
MEGVILTPLKQIVNPKGDLYHAMKQSDNGYKSFGEAYFSTVIKDEIKGWKKHTVMVLNLIVPIGAVEFIIYDDRIDSSTKNQFFSLILSQENYQRLTVPAGVWMAFKGIGEDLNMLLNIASIEHDPSEAITKQLTDINYTWN